MISAYGLFFLGVVQYQGFILFYVLVRKARDVEPNLLALIDGLRPITRLALHGSVGWLAGLSMITLPVLVLGFNDYGAIWYIGFYGLHYVSELVVFLGLSFGFHKAMVSSKRILLLNLGKTLNEMYSGYERQIMDTGTSDKDLDSLIMVYSCISGGKNGLLSGRVFLIFCCLTCFLSYAPFLDSIYEIVKAHTSHVVDRCFRNTWRSYHPKGKTKMRRCSDVEAVKK